MSDRNVAFEKVAGGGMLCIVLTAPCVCRICILLVHFSNFGQGTA